MTFPQLFDSTLRGWWRPRRFAGFLAAALFFFALAQSAMAQTAETAVIRGAVADQNGAAVANAQITIRNDALDFKAALTTDANGHFETPALRFGEYSIRIAAVTFADFEQTVAAAAQQPDTDLQIRLQPSGVNANVTVEAGYDDPDNNIRVENSNVATRIDASVLETPATINTVTEKVLEDRQVRQADKALVFVPGVSYSGSNTGGSTEEFVLRGFSTNRRIFIDGFRNSFRFNQTDLGDIERIDILKGASGVLYGTAFPGGTVNYSTKRPRGGDRYLTVSQAAGNYSFYRTEIDGGGAFANDHAQYRIIGAGQISNQTTHGRNSRELKDDRVLFAPSARVVLPSQATIDYAFEFYYLNLPVSTGIVYTRANGFLFDSPPFIAKNDFWEHYNYRHKLEFRQPFADNHSVYLGAVYHPSNWIQRRNSTFGPPTILNGGKLNINRNRNDDESLIATYRGEVAGRSRLTDWLEIRPIAGGEFVRDAFNFEGARSATVVNQIDPLNPVFPVLPSFIPLTPGQTAARTDEAAVYAQNLTKLFGKFNLLTGIRYLDYKRTITAFQGTAAQPNPTAQQRAQLEPRESAVDYTVSAIYNIAPYFSPFGGYSTSTEVQLAILNTATSAPPRKSKQIEGGLKSALLNNNLLLSASVYRIDQTGVVETIPGTNPAIGQLVGEVRSQGFELEATGKINRRLSVYGGYSYTDAFVSRSVATVSNQPFAAISLLGKPLVAVPKHQFSIYGDYSIFNDDNQSISFNAGLLGVFDRTGDTAARFTLPDYGRVDTGANYRYKRLKLNLAIENLLDKRYVAGSSDASFVYQGARRTATAKISYSF